MFSKLQKLCLAHLWGACAFFLLFYSSVQNNCFAQLTADFSTNRTEGCSPLTVCFTDHSTGWPNSWLWDFGNGNFSTDRNPCVIYPTPGTYTVSLTVAYGSNSNSKTVTDLISVFANPVVDFIATSTSACSFEAITFTDMTTLGDAPIAWWRWGFGDGNSSALQNPAHVYDEPGVYAVLLEVYDSNGCNHNLSLASGITIHPSPTVTADATLSSSCSSLSVAFEDQSPSGTIVDRLWDFGDGTNSNQQNPTHTYTAPGTYTVLLTITDTAGCSSTDTLSIPLGSGSTLADFSVDDTSGCGSLSAVFTDLSSSSGTITSWHWDFGDSGTSTAQNPTHNYTAPGTYDVTLTVTDNSGCIDEITYDDLITVYAFPTADFTANQTQGCGIPFTINFTETATGEVSWFWEFGDGQTSTQQNPSHSYAASGSYGVRLTVTSADGCTRTSFKPNYINISSPTANFTAAKMSGSCLGPTRYAFTDQASAAASWSWNFDDGGTSTAQNPTHDFAAAGQYDVMLIITNADGCSDTVTKPVTVVAASVPVADFTTNDAPVCLPENISFSDASVSDSAIVSWNWAFGDASTSSSQNPSHTYTTVGTFTVALIIETVAGCRDTVSKTVETNGSSLIADAGPDAAICIGDTTVLAGSGGSSYSWNNSASLSNPNISNPSAFPTATTTYILTIYDSLGCASTDDVTITVHPLPEVSASPAAICTGDSAQLSATGGVSYSWSPASTLNNANVSNPIANPLSTTTYSVTVTDVNGCVNSVNTTLVVHPLPTVSVSASNNTICEGQTVQLSATGGTSYSWSPATWLNDPDIPNPVSTPGNSIGYVATGVDSNGCENSDAVSITVNPAPAHTVSPDTSICSGDTVPLTASGGTTYSWHPATGLSCTACGNPDAFPATTTTYYVDISDGAGCTVADSVTVTVFSAQASSVTPDTSICNGSSVQLSASSGASYTWSPATGLNNAFISSPLATPDSSITYTVHVTSSSGCSWSDSVHIEVSEVNADMTFSGNVGCAPVTVQFTDLSSSTVPIASWTWDFGDGNTSSLQNPSHTFTSVGIFTVNLTIETTAGCLDTVSKTVETSSPSVVADAGSDVTICSGDTTALTGSGGVTFSWSPSSSLSNANIANPSAFPSSTTIYVLTVFDSIGCADTDDVTVTVLSAQASGVSNDTFICKSGSVQLNATGGTTYEWSPAIALDDAFAQSPVASPDSTTTYTVRITSASGCSWNDTVHIEVLNVNADMAFSGNVGCAPVNVQFTDNSSSDDSIASWQWAFGDGNSSSLQNPSHTYSSGSFTATLIIETSAGCRDTVSKTVEVSSSSVVANAGPDVSICSRDTTALTGSGGVTFSWSPSASLSNENIANPSAFPSSTTIYVLTVFDSIGCADTDDVTVTVHPLPVVDASPAAICTGDSAQLSASGGMSYSWSPASTLNNPNISNPIANPLSTTTYNVTVTDVNGCVNSVSATLVVHPLPVVNVSSVNKTICYGESVQLNAGGGESYSWSPATWLSDAAIPNPVSTPLLSTNYSVTATDINGCENTGSVAITVYPMPVYSVSSDTSICNGDTVGLSVSGGTSFVWYPSAGLSCTACSNPDAYPATTTTYYVNSTDAAGCTFTDSVTVTVFSQQTVTITPDTFICNGGSVQLNATGGTNYEWTPATGLDNALVPFPVASPDSSTTYTVSISSPSGCSWNDSVRVEVLELNANFSLSESTGCLPFDVQFTDFSSSDAPIVSWQWNFDDGNISNVQHPNHVFETAGTHNIILTVTTAGGCSGSASASITVNPLPVAVAGPDAAICDGGAVQLAGSGGMQYIWSPPSGLSATDIPNPTASPDVTRHYELIVIDANGCLDVDSVLITVGNLPITTISGNASLCYGDSVQLEVAGGNSYSWSPATGLNNPLIPNPVARPEASTTYVVHVQTNLGCDAVDSVEVTVYPKPTISINADNEICIGDTTQFRVSGAMSYEWFPPTGLSCADCPNPVAITDASTTYFLTMTDNNNCIWRDTIPLAVSPAPQIHTTDDKMICKGESVELTSTYSGATVFEWTPGFGLSSYDTPSPVASPEKTTEYVIVARNTSGCAASDTVLINVIDQIHAVVTDNMRMCPGESVTMESRVTISGSAETSVLWFPEDAFADPASPVQTVSPTATTTYMLVASGGQCTSDTQYVHIHVDESPEVDAGDDQTVMAGTEVSFTATSSSNITAFYWSPSAEVTCFDCQTTGITANESGIYYVSVTDANGCTAKDSVMVQVLKTCDGDIWLPNAFTPNGDESNDLFRVRSLGFIDLISFRIFGRWGNLIFETDDINQGWDGKYKGEFVNPEVYVWSVRARCSDGNEVEKSGNVTVIR